jgi:hypothetical protein
MATEAQIEANRINAQKSTGPRTPEGKEKASHNALKHGLLAKDVVVMGEDIDDFALFRDELRAELAPVGLVEARLVERIAGLMWRLQRAERVQTESFDLLYSQCAVDPHAKRKWPNPGPDVTDPFLSLTVVKDFSETRILERLLGYERRIENSLCRMMAELRKVQGQRQAAAGAAATSPRAAVRDPHPADLPRADPYRAGRRSGPVRKVPPLDLALDNLLAKIIAVEGRRAGTMANTPAQQSCQTKPIAEEVASVKCEVSSEEGPAATPLSLATSDFPLETAAQPQTCQTNPICTSPRGTGILPVNTNYGQDAHATASAAFCQTKPIVGPDKRQVLDGQEVTRNSVQGEAGRAEPEEASYRPVHCVGRPAVRS